MFRPYSYHVYKSKMYYTPLNIYNGTYERYSKIFERVPLPIHITDKSLVGNRLGYGGGGGGEDGGSDNDPWIIAFVATAFICYFQHK